MKREQQLQRVREQLAAIDRQMDEPGADGKACLRIRAMYTGPEGEQADSEFRALNARSLELQGEEQRLKAGMTPTQWRAARVKEEKELQDQYRRFARRERLIKLGVIRPDAHNAATIVGNRTNGAGGML